jgi:hypothetical protein
MKSLPARPSLESLRKQAKKLSRDVTAGDAAALARVRAVLPTIQLPLTQRNAQHIIAREYGYVGWNEITEEVTKRVGNGLDWAVAQARRAIHDSELERLKQLLAEYPALLSWTGGEDGSGLLGFATGAYGDAYGEERERWFTRGAAAEVLIDAGAIVVPTVPEGILRSRAKGLLELFHRKGLLPKTLKFFAARDDVTAVFTALRENTYDLATITEAFVCATRFEREVASVLLERAIILDPDLGRRIDESVGRREFVQYFMKNRPSHALEVGLWKSFVMSHVMNAISENDLPSFVDQLKRESWLLGDDHVRFQTELLEHAAFLGRKDFIDALLDLAPAILGVQPPPASQAIEHAITYVHTDVLPSLARVWPLPDDLPSAAGVGDLARVKKWFDDTGAPALGNIRQHYPYDSPRARDELEWAPASVQRILDTALAFAVLNRHFDVADFLLEHGADINTNWNSHEPASILHTLVFEDNYESMRYLIDRGIDMTIKDYRWDSTAIGWARYGKSDEKMAQWLEEAERQRATLGREPE